MLLGFQPINTKDSSTFILATFTQYTGIPKWQELSFSNLIQ